MLGTKCTSKYIFHEILSIHPINLDNVKKFVVIDAHLCEHIYICICIQMVVYMYVPYGLDMYINTYLLPT